VKKLVVSTTFLFANRLFTNPVGMWFLLGAGAAAFSIDYFTLQAYSRGLPISVGAPVGIAGGVATAVVIGLLLGEQLSFAKLGGIVLVLSAESFWLPLNGRFTVAFRGGGHEGICRRKGGCRALL
jgi:multidrug transporter EmrE-like cation transporter